MISLDSVRLTLIAVLVLLAQAAFAARFPEWRVGADPYILFLLLVTASRGAVHGGVFALAGGAVMDSFSILFPAFHVFFYLVPVAAALLMRSGMLLNYSQLAGLTVTGLLLGKVLMQYLIGTAAGWLVGTVPLLDVNYVAILLMGLLTTVAWPRLAALLVPRLARVRNG